jgi:heptosyltransferase-2
MDILSKKWKRSRLPKRILAIRLQAMGDLVITLPYLQSLRNSLPENTRLDLLTRVEVESIPRNLGLFNTVYSIGGGRNFKKQLIYAFFLLPVILFRRYQVVIDLQDNIISRGFLKIINPKAWSVFDRFSALAAGDRTRLTIEAVGLGYCNPDSRFKLKNQEDGLKILKENGWDKNFELVILNPAGAFESRNWQLPNYVAFAHLWLEHYPQTRFLVLGTRIIKEKSDFLKSQLGIHLINLVDKTSPYEAFAIIQRAKLVLSEDSGLMHMSWVSGIPTLVLFGSTESRKARPLGDFTAYLDSSDLACGPCQREYCKYGDTYCLARYSPRIVFDKAMGLLEGIS